MKKINFSIVLSILASLSLSLSCSSPVKKNSPKAAAPMVAALSGDFPDPSVIKVGKTYWAAATSSAWLPAFPIMRSDDLANWKVVGSVYPQKPKWTDGNFWAPELSFMDNKYFVYYSAKHKGHGRMCLGVGTSANVEGPYQDHGPMICQPPGSIDAMPVVDDKGQKWVFWKEDGNSMGKPTPIWLSKLSQDGTKLEGSMTEVMRNDAVWEGNLIEGPFVMKKGNHWYMFYAAHACCTRECNYAVGVARSKELQGPWEKNPANPILKGNDQWSCPGHGSVVTDEKGRDAFMYHAYHMQDSVYVGRQAMVDEVQWQADGWPTINNNRGPGLSFLQDIARNKEHQFVDEFSGAIVAPEWQWPQQINSEVKLQNDQLEITSLGPDKNPLSAFIGKSTTMGDYTAETVVDFKSLSKGGMATLAAVGNMENAVGVSVESASIRLWTRKKGKQFPVASYPLSFSEKIHLRLITRHGNSFEFYQSTDGKNWHIVGSAQNGEHLPPWDLGIRVALGAGGTKGSVARFDSIKISAEK